MDSLNSENTVLNFFQLLRQFTEFLGKSPTELIEEVDKEEHNPKTLKGRIKSYFEGNCQIKWQKTLANFLLRLRAPNFTKNKAGWFSTLCFPRFWRSNGFWWKWPQTKGVRAKFSEFLNLQSNNVMMFKWLELA